MKQNFLLKLAFLVLTLLFLPQATFALSVAPPRQAVTIEPGESKTLRISVKNETKKPVRIKPKVTGFSVDDKTGAANFQSTDEARNWLEYDKNTFRLSASSSKKFSFSVKIPNSAESKSHYLALFFEQINPNKQLQVNSRVGSLLFLYVGGTVREALVLDQFSPRKKVFFSKPAKLNFSLKNKGSIHVIPRGQLSFTQNNQQVAAKKINKKETLVVPESNFSASVSLSDLSWRDFGKINADLVVQYGKTNKALSGRAEFWYFPKYILFVVAFIIILFLVLFSLLAKKARNG
jgi:hypothetical protein